MDHSLPQRQPVDRPSRAHGLVGGAAPQFLAIDASRALVDLGLLSKPQTSNCRPATGETIGKAKACRAGGTVQVYLNLAGRDPAGGGLTQVADAMRLKYPGVDAAYTNSGGLRADLNCAPPSAGESACEITWGEMFSVLPFGNRTVIETLTGAQLELAFLNGFSPKCNPAIATGRFPQISGLKAQYLQRAPARCRRHLEGAERRDRGAHAGRADRHRPVRDQRLHVHRR